MLDGSGVAEEAIPVVEMMAGHPIQAVKLLRVVADPSDRRLAAMYLGAIATRLAAAHLVVDVCVEVGDPTLVVGKAADGTDMIVLCTHGRGGIDRLRHGSVADRVVRQVEQPVLLVRAGVPARVPATSATGL
jgi:nucleotide-binding universal stress UspA family protein